MRNVKVLISSVLVGIVASTSVAMADFVDMPTDAPVLRTALEHAVENGLLTGTSETTIEPYSTITRAEMGTIIVRALGATEEANLNAFSDVAPTDWYYPYMSKAVAMGAFAGSDGKLNPEDPISTQEAFIVMSRVLDIQDCMVNPKKSSDAAHLAQVQANIDKALAGYTDAATFEDWAIPYIANIAYNNYWTISGNLNPTAPFTRGDFAMLMDNMVKTYINEPGEYTSLVDGNVIIRSTGVTLNGVSNVGDIIIGEAAEGSGAEQNITYIKGSDLNRIILRGGKLSVSTSDFKFARLEKANSYMYLSDYNKNMSIWGNPAGALVDLGVVNGTK